MRSYFLFIALITSSLQPIYSQIFQEEYMNRQDSSLAKGDVFFDIQASSWFFNNEYFNPFYKGYTLIGGNFRPLLVYQSNSKLKINTGADLHRYYGDNIKTSVIPLFSLEYRAIDNFSILMGSYTGGENHLLNEVLYSFENHLTDLIENGILIRYSNWFINSETWLNWESFIHPGDTIQEQFTAGSSNQVMLINSPSWKLSIPISLLAHHKGGQINITDKHIETLLNINEGLKISRDFKTNSLKNLYASFAVFHSLGDYDPAPGWGISVKAGIKLKHLEMNAGYFRANDFASFDGNQLFCSWKTTGDPLKPYNYGGKQEILNFKTGFRQKIGRDSFMFIRFDGYYFTGLTKLDYSYSLHFQVNDFFKAGNLFQVF
jgi:hypothetical protein